MSKNVIEVESLNSYYQRRHILKNVNLSVAEGEIRVIMGGSGSGKSTLLRYLLGLEPCEQGHIRILGLDMGSANKHELYQLRRNIGVSFQNGALFSSMSILDNVMFPLREHTQLDEKTMQIMARMKLEVVNLSGCEYFLPAELSGGMLKRAALARAIVMDPKLLFFDEPSAGLDPVASAQLDDLILKLRSAMDMSIVVVTHELDSTFKIADQITILDRGEVVITENVDAVRATTNQRVQDLLNRRSGNSDHPNDDYIDRLTM